MKRNLWILLLLTVALLLAACAPAAGPSGIAPETTSETEPTEETEPTTTPTTEPTTAPTTAPTAAPTEPTVAPTTPPTQLTEEMQFENLIREEYWYSRALGCTFEKPQDIALQFYFYNGIPGGAYHENTFTTEEKTAIEEAYTQKYGKAPVTGATKLPVSEINKALACLDLTLADMQIPTDWIYYAEADAYYFWKSDAYGVVSWQVTEVVKAADDTVKLYWETDQIHYNTATGEYWTNGAKMVLTIREKGDGTYLILSNLPAE